MITNTHIAISLGATAVFFGAGAWLNHCTNKQIRQRAAIIKSIREEHEHIHTNYILFDTVSETAWFLRLFFGLSPVSLFKPSLRPLVREALHGRTK